MFCSQCGKKVLESMLFCPFCGAPIVIPDQESAAPQPPAEPERVEQFAPPDERSEDVVPEQEAFRPLSLSDFEAEPAEEPKPSEEETLGERPNGPLRGEPVKLQGRVPDLTHVQSPRQSGKGSSRRSATLAPVREFDPDDMFLDGGDREERDEVEDDDYAYEEPEEGSFWIRHIRGVVALSLILVVVAIVAGWAFSGAGQSALARADLAWNPEVYAELAYDAYKQENYLLSANYYERALARDADSYTYANSAGVAYYLAGETARSMEMGRRAIEIDPSKGDAYLLLLRLYPDAESRPWEITSLLQQGYRLTGDASLKVE